MTDLEITKLCAEAMGWKHFSEVPDKQLLWVNPNEDSFAGQFRYDPLNDDAQAMALVKKLKLIAGTRVDGKFFCASGVDHYFYVYKDYLNRAICECVAKMEADRQLGQPHRGHG